jgi:hypothetical protein
MLHGKRCFALFLLRRLPNVQSLLAAAAAAVGTSLGSSLSAAHCHMHAAAVQQLHALLQHDVTLSLPGLHLLPAAASAATSAHVAAWSHVKYLHYAMAV